MDVFVCSSSTAGESDDQYNYTPPESFTASSPSLVDTEPLATPTPTPPPSHTPPSPPSHNTLTLDEVCTPPLTPSQRESPPTTPTTPLLVETPQVK